MSDRSNPENAKLASRVRLKSIEAFHLFSSTDQFPNSVTSRLHFQGQLNVKHARNAWSLCMRRHVFSTWPIETSGRPNWKTSEPFEEEILQSTFRELELTSWPESELEFALPNVSKGGLFEVDARRGPGLGMWCVRDVSRQRTTIFVAASHALTDGAAAINVLREWMQIYHNLENQIEISKGLVKLDWHRWNQRSRLGLLDWSFLKFLPMQAIGLFGASKFILRKFSTIEANDGSEPSTDQSFSSPGIVGRTVNAQTVSDINDRADRLDVSENSLLMTIAFRALAKLARDIPSSDQCRWMERKWIRFVLPISIRNLADRNLPSANRASIVQIERTKAQLSNADAASQSIDREIKIIMGFRLQFVFLIAIRLISFSTTLLRWVASNAKSRGTAVFTNLSEPFRKTRSCDFREVGGLKLVEYDLVGPIREGTPINIAWSKSRNLEGPEVSGRISIHFDQRIISKECAIRLLNIVDAEMIDIAQFGGSALSN